MPVAPKALQVVTGPVCLGREGMALFLAGAQGKMQGHPEGSKQTQPPGGGQTGQQVLRAGRMFKDNIRPFPVHMGKGQCGFLSASTRAFYLPRSGSWMTRCPEKKPQFSLRLGLSQKERGWSCGGSSGTVGMAHCQLSAVHPPERLA